MKNYKLSDTYKILYDYIIGDLLSQIFEKDHRYCIRNKEIPFLIGEKFEAYKNNALKYMPGTRLDKHKLASCICGAIIEVKPLAGFNGIEISKNTN